MQSKAKSMPLKNSTQKSATKRHKTNLKQQKPAPIAAGSKEFIKLQREWYKKAADSGFEDLEVFKGSLLEPLSMLQGTSLTNIANQYSSEKAHYYRLWSCFLAFNEANLAPRDRLIARLYSDGIIYRDIIKEVNKRFTRKISLNPLHFIIKRLEREVRNWNVISPNGLDFESDVADISSPISIPIPKR